MRVRELLQQKGHRIHAIRGEQSVAEAIQALTANRISALLILDGDQLQGIFTERDVLGCTVKFPGKDFAAIPVRDAMTTKLIVAELDDDLTATMSMMIQADIRHLPVVDQGRLEGLLSIRDLVQQVVGSLTAELHHLQDYIVDLQDAAID